MAQVTVLVIDDDPVILQLLRVNFELEGYRVLSAGDGQEGIDMARSQHPDVVVSDIMMPNIDGLELTAALKADPNTRHLPIILVSAKAQTADVQKGLDLGADDYVTKPFDPLELIDRVTSVLARPRR